MSLLLFSCAKESMTTIDSETEFPSTGEVVGATIYGAVLNEEGPIENAQVQLKSSDVFLTTMTDEYGNFLFENIKNKGATAYITVVKDGKFDAFRRMGVTAEKYNYTQIKMVDKIVLGSINNAQGSTLSHDSGAKITLASNGVIDNNGNIVNGNYDVSMSWIDPSSDDLAQRMVGDLSGIDEEGNIRALGSFGMLQVELNGANGEELNLTKDAELEFPVPASMLNNAPSSIPLWSFDEEHGYWVEDGSATLVGNKYIGSVSHFSTWNVDTKDDPMDISGTFVIENEGRLLPPSYYEVRLCMENGTSAGGWLCDDGHFEFINVPQGQSMTLKLIDYCGVEVYSTEIGPYTEEVIDLGEIEVLSSTVLSVENIVGNAVDCDLNEITNGHVLVNYNNFSQIYPLDENGAFDILITVCEEFEISFQVIDETSFTTSDPIPVTSWDGIFEFNDILVCTELDSYVHFVIEGHLDVLRTEDISVGWFVNEALVGDTAMIFNAVMQNGGFEFITLTWDKKTEVGVPTPGITVDENNTLFSFQNGTVNYSCPAENVETLLEIAPTGFSSWDTKGSFNGLIEIDGVDTPIYGSFKYQ